MHNQGHHDCGELCALIQAIGQGEEAAWNRLVQAMHTDWLVLAQGVCGCPALAEDAVQEACCTILRRAAAFRPRPPRRDHSARAWMARIVTNAARCLLRSERRRQHRHALVRQEAVCDGVHDDDDRADSLHHGLARLPASLRSVIRLRYWQECDHAAIARKLGCSAGAARTRLHRAHAMLRRVMTPLILLTILGGGLWTYRHAIQNDQPAGPPEPRLGHIVCLEDGFIDLDRGLVVIGNADPARRMVFTCEPAGPVQRPTSLSAFGKTYPLVWSRADDGSTRVAVQGFPGDTPLTGHICRLPSRPMPSWLKQYR